MSVVNKRKQSNQSPKSVRPSGLKAVLDRLTSEDARKTPTFLLVGAGAAQADSLADELKLPLAHSVRDQLLQAHYGATAEKCLTQFIAETGMSDPTSDQVWQFLIRNPSKLRNHAERLQTEFNPCKPIPPAYHMLARWFLSGDLAIAGIATTNFDLQFSQAFYNVAEALNQKRGTDYDVAEIPQDFRYFSDCAKDSGRVIQRLHGTLDRPWSIVAGAKESIYDISHYLHEYVRSHEKNPFYLLAQLVQILNPESNETAKHEFYPYKYLEEAVSKARTIIVLGYSFQDRELADSFAAGASSGQEIYVVDTAPFWKTRNRLKFLSRAIHVRVSAETFLNGYVRALQEEKQLIQLPMRERTVLREGTAHVTGRPKKRLISSEVKGDISSFMDPLYGPFRFAPTFPDLERDILKIVDTGEVQRLRQIKQLSFVHLKYHGATHDRFTHTVGVAYLADLLMRYWRTDGSRVAPGADKGRSMDRGDHLAFVTCALIHDIGHGPFGHTMDLVRAKLKDSGSHEKDTGRIFQQIFGEDSFGDLDLALRDVDVAHNGVNRILGRQFGVVTDDDSEVDELHLALDNDGCDIDRLDFVMRDAGATLLPLRGDDRDIKSHHDKLLSGYSELLQGMRIHGTKGGAAVMFEERVKPLLESFTFLYLKLYNDVYYSWQNVCAQAMLAEAVAEVVRSRKVELADIKPLTDVELLATLEEFENPKVSELAYLVKYRRIFGLAGEKDMTATEAQRCKTWSDEKIVTDLLSIQYRPGMLVARLPKKSVVVNLISRNSEVGGEGVLWRDRLYENVELGSTCPKIMVFDPGISDRRTR